ncbi:MAG: CHAT domain-containing protein [Cyclobacteriaceae bacterium]|nr:CHAT domain-containing protein [Cyclobacteriaceae bacterium]
MTARTVMASIFAALSIVVFGQQWEELNGKGIYYYNKGKLKKAVAQFEQGIIKAEEEFGTAHINYATACYNLASLYEELKQPDKAIPLYKTHFRLLKQLKGINEKKAIELNNTGNYAARNRFYADALIFWSEARDAFASLPDGDPEWYAITCSNVATGFQQTNQPDSAEANFLRSLATYEKMGKKCSKEYYEDLQALKILYGLNRNRFSKNKLLDASERIRDCSVQLYGPLSKEYLQAITDLADVKLFIEDYNQALVYLDECLAIVNSNASVEKDLKANLMLNRAHALRELGKLKEGEEWVLKTKALLEDEKVKYAQTYISTLTRLSGFKMLQGELLQAEKLLIDASDFNQKNLKDDDDQLTIIDQLASIYFLKGDIKKSESLSLTYYQQAKAKENENPGRYYFACNNLVTFYYETGNYEKSLQLGKETCELSRRLFGGDSERYAGDCINLGAVYVKLENFKEAESVLTEALSILKNVKGTDCEEYALGLFFLADVYDEYVLYDKALELRAEALRTYEKIFGRNHYKFAHAAKTMATAYARQDRFSEAEQLHLEALEIFKKTFGEKQADYAKQCYHLGSIYHDAGNFPLAGQWLLKALSLQEELFGKDHPDYGKTLNVLAILYSDQGDFVKAEQLFLEARGNAEKTVGRNHDDYLQITNNLAVLYDELGQYDKAEKIFRDIVLVRESLQGRNHPKYAFAIVRLASTLTSMGRYQEAGELLESAFSIITKTLGTDNLHYAEICGSLAYYYNKINKHEKAETLCAEIREVRAKFQGKSHVDYASACNSLAFTKDKNGKIAEAEQLYNEARMILLNTGLTRHPLYATVCNNLASVYENQQRYADAFHLYTQSGRSYINELNSNFLLLSESEREKYLEEFNYFRDIYFSFVLGVAGKLERAPAWAFRYNMLTKGVLFRAAKSFREEIQNTNDDELRKLFNEYQSLKSKFAKALTLSEQQLIERNINPNDLREKVAEAEKSLLRKSQLLNRNTSDTIYNWKDIQKLLKPDEALVEWIRLEYYNNRWTDSVIYLAFVIRPGQIRPEYVVLNNGNDLEGREIKFYQNTILAGLENNRSYDIYWKPLEPKLKNVKRIYVVPDGIYHNINLNTLYNPVLGKYLSDQYAVHLLGSSLDFIKYRSKPAEQRKSYKQYKAYLFGYPDYTGKKEKSPYSLSEKERIRNFIRKDSSQRFFDQAEGHVTILEGTRTEVNTIATLLKNKGVPAVLLTGQDASEKQLKQLNNPEILHIATHGFFLSNTNRLDPDRQVRVKENPLMRSGLLLAGAERGLRGEVDYTDEDGILFANEVQLLNLKNTELVVLSACETGLGEIKNGEGVYGLQRALQEAGAKNIVMSLWKVDDHVTQELMTQFYTQLFSGKSKRAAFEEAQALIRNKYPHPYYWGAFVLIGE